MKYADVILPLPLENSYTYRIPEDLERAVTPGCRVIVHFGKKRYYTAIVMEVHDREPVCDFETKEIYALLDATPVLRRPQLRFWKWILPHGRARQRLVCGGFRADSELLRPAHQHSAARARLEHAGGKTARHHLLPRREHAARYRLRHVRQSYCSALC